MHCITSKRHSHTTNNFFGRDLASKVHTLSRFTILFFHKLMLVLLLLLFFFVCYYSQTTRHHVSDLNLTIHSLASKYSEERDVYISKASHYSSYEANLLVLMQSHLIQRQPVGGKDRKCILMTLFFYRVLLCCCAMCQVAVSLWLFDSREHDINKNVNPLKVVNNNTEWTNKNVRSRKKYVLMRCIDTLTHTHTLDNQSEIDFLYIGIFRMGCCVCMWVCVCVR